MTLADRHAQRPRFLSRATTEAASLADGATLASTRDHWVPLNPPPVLSDEQPALLLAACRGTT